MSAQFEQGLLSDISQSRSSVPLLSKYAPVRDGANFNPLLRLWLQLCLDLDRPTFLFTSPSQDSWLKKRRTIQLAFSGGSSQTQREATSELHCRPSCTYLYGTLTLRLLPNTRQQGHLEVGAKQAASVNVQASAGYGARQSALLKDDVENEEPF